jgi:16S rRNA (guanine527-N7)-methyltransferase
MHLTHVRAYEARGLDQSAIDKLGLFGNLLLNAPFNVTSIRDAEAVERLHFLDCLSLLDLEPVRMARRLVDLGAGGGLPALVLALALPGTMVTAVESQQKKCNFIREVATAMGLANVDVCCSRAEEYGQNAGRGAHDVAVSRALASLPVLAEYSIPLLAVGGAMVAMKGEISNQECIQAQKALDILGGGRLESLRLHPFEGAENRWVYMAAKVKATPASLPRRPGTPTKQPLGQ